MGDHAGRPGAALLFLFSFSFDHYFSLTLRASIPLAHLAHTGTWSLAGNFSGVGFHMYCTRRRGAHTAHTQVGWPTHEAHTFHEPLTEYRMPFAGAREGGGGDLNRIWSVPEVRRAPGTGRGARSLTISLLIDA